MQQQQQKQQREREREQQQRQMGVKQRQKASRVVITQNTTTASRRGCNEARPAGWKQTGRIMALAQVERRGGRVGRRGRWSAVRTCRPCTVWHFWHGTWNYATSDKGQRAEGTGHRAQGNGQLLAQQSPFNLFCSRGSSPLSLMSLALTIIAAHVAYT